MSISGPATCADLLGEMARINSVNSAISGDARAEQRLTEFLHERARAFGLAARRLPVAGRADNLLVTCQREAGAPWVLFESHMDTVGVEDVTVEPFAASVIGRRMHGRGSCDTKGSGAAMLWALAAYASRPHGPNNVALLFTVDEEISRAGIDAFVGEQLPELGWRPVGAIVGEPTGLRIVVAHKGVVRLSIRTEGVPAHSSDPSRGNSAIRMMLPVLEALETRYLPRISATHPLTGPAVGSINVISGGSQVNIIPASCEIGLDRRTVPGEDPGQVIAELEQLLAELRQADPDLTVSVHDAVVHAALDPVGSESFARHVGDVLAANGLSAEPIGAGYGTHAGTLASVAAIPAVVVGPGDIAQAHTADEWLDLDELDRAVNVYGAMMAAELPVRPASA